MKLIDRHNVKELRKFGIALAVMFPLIFFLFLPWLFERPGPRWPLIVGAVFLLAALVWPRGLYPVYRGWMRVAGVLGHFTNFIVLGTVFFIMMVPLGLILRSLGKLQYREGFDSKAETYRVGTRRRPAASDLNNPF